MGRNLTPLDIKQMEQLVSGRDIAGSDRAGDRSRTKLKNLGFIRFDRDDWRWQITEAGRAALKETVG